MAETKIFDDSLEMGLQQPLIVLHIGGPKCGSSSLQTFLTANPLLKTTRGALFEYWKIETHLNLQKVSIFSPVTNSTQIRGISYQASNQLKSRLVDECLHEIFEKFISENNPEQNKIFFFSSESWASDYQSLDLQSCICKIKKFKIIVFQYVRPQIDMLASAYLQWTLWSENPTFEECFNMLKSISDWEIQANNVLKSGADQIMVRYSNNIVQDVCDLLNIDASSVRNEVEKRVNKSLPIEALTLLLRNRELRKAVHNPYYDFLIEDYIDQMNYKPTPVQLVFEKKSVDAIQDYFHVNNLKLMERLNSEQSDAFRLSLFESETKYQEGLRIEDLGKVEIDVIFLENLTVQLLLDFVKIHHERDLAHHERDLAHHERDLAHHERDLITNSRTWRLLKLYRTIKNKTARDQLN